MSNNYFQSKNLYWQSWRSVQDMYLMLSNFFSETDTCDEMLWKFLLHRTRQREYITHVKL